jgi:hypothetical protein
VKNKIIYKQYDGFIYVCMYIYIYTYIMPISEAARSKAWVCGRALAGIAGSNPAGEWLSLCCGCCVGMADHSYRRVLPSVVCLSVIVKPGVWGGAGLLGAVAPWNYIYIYIYNFFFDFWSDIIRQHGIKVSFVVRTLYLWIGLKIYRVL